MALGIAGSNGGIGTEKISANIIKGFGRAPLEVSYFVNNVCNLKCEHCYVGLKHEQATLPLSVSEWEKFFEDCLKIGALTFGNVGKEPTLDWEKSISLLRWLAKRSKAIERLRFGLVTNGILLDDAKIADLVDIMPTYLDISLDGDRRAHDLIRGAGMHEILMKNLSKLASCPSLRERVFISFTLGHLNVHCIENVVCDIYAMGFKNLLISPYATLDASDALYLSDEAMATTIKQLIAGELVDFSSYNNLNIYFKTDFSITRSLVEKMKDIGIIKEDALLIDDYGLIFNKYEFASNAVYINYMPFETPAIRISHDGYVGKCLDMFYDDFPARAVGNVRDKSIKLIMD